MNDKRGREIAIPLIDFETRRWDASGLLKIGTVAEGVDAYNGNKADSLQFPRIVSYARFDPLPVSDRSRRMNIRMDEEVAYVLETAKEVGLEVDENTALNFGFIAEIIRRLKEQTDERH